MFVWSVSSMQRLSGGLFPARDPERNRGEKPGKTINADYNPVADAEAILAEDTIASQYVEAGLLEGALAL